MMRGMIAGLFATAALLGAAAHAQTAPSYRLSASVPLGAPNHWDYVVFSPETGRVYVAHGDRLTVVDAGRPAVVGEVTGIPGGTHGVAIAAAEGLGYTDDGEAGEAVAFDLKTLKVVKHIPAAKDADAVARDPVTGHVFIIDGDSGVITVVDPKTDAAVATIHAGGKLEYAVADGGGKLYVNGAGNRELLRIDTRTNAVEARWPIPDCLSPHGLAIDPVRRRLFSSCVNGRLVVVDADTGRQVAMLPIGLGTDSAGYDPVRRRVFSSNGSGTLSVIQQDGADAYHVLDTVQTARTGRTMGLDPRTGRIFIVAGDPGPPPAPGQHGGIAPGSLKLLVLDPAS